MIGWDSATLAIALLLAIVVFVCLEYVGALDLNFTLTEKFMGPLLMVFKEMEVPDLDDVTVIEAIAQEMYDTLFEQRVDVKRVFFVEERVSDLSISRKGVKVGFFFHGTTAEKVETPGFRYEFVKRRGYLKTPYMAINVRWRWIFRRRKGRLLRSAKVKRVGGDTAILTFFRFGISPSNRIRFYSVSWNAMLPAAPEDNLSILGDSQERKKKKM